MTSVCSSDGTEIAYDRLGQGPVLIYVTGATCFRSFGPIQKDAKALAAHFTVINYDRRGRGDSGDTPPYALDRELDDLEALIDAHGGQAIVYGHSSGAVLAAEAGLRLRSKILRLVLYDPAYPHRDELPSYHALILRVEELLHQQQPAAALRAFLVGIGMPRPFVWLLPLLPDWKRMVRLAPTLAYDIALTRNLAPTDRLARLDVPTLVVVGEKSPEGMRLVGSELERCIPGARLEILAGQGHMVDATALLPMLREF
jgi:pimeloyl-ACP methyl ester carboxylesterase